MPLPPQDPTCRAYLCGCCPVLEVSARLLGAKLCFNKEEIPASRKFTMKVLAARKANVITACARKN